MNDSKYLDSLIQALSDDIVDHNTKKFHEELIVRVKRNMVIVDLREFMGEYNDSQ